jgi:uncharacterized membrane protein
MSRLTKSLAIFLLASVLMNVFLVGLFAGRIARGRSHEARGVDPSTQGEIDSSAPMRGVWRRHDAALRPRSEAVDSARQAVREALVAEPFKPETLEAALLRLRTETGGAQEALHRALVETAREQSLEDRRRLAASRWFLGPGPRRGFDGR